MSPILTVVLVLVAAAVAGALGFTSAVKTASAPPSRSRGLEEEAKRIVNDAIKAAEQKRKETIIEAKDEAFKLKSDADKEIKDRRAEITRQERRIDQKERPSTSALPRWSARRRTSSAAVRPWRPAWTSWSSSSCARPAGNHRRHVQGGRPRRVAQAGR